MDDVLEIVPKLIDDADGPLTQIELAIDDLHGFACPQREQRAGSSLHWRVAIVMN